MKLNAIKYLDYVHWNALLPIAMHQAATLAHEQENQATKLMDSRAFYLLTR